MYNRSQRQLAPPAHPHRPAPGAYEPNAPAAKHSEAYAPFGALAPRETLFETAALASEQPPAPGQYNIARPVASSAIGGSSLANKSKRFTTPPAAAPPVGHYAVTRSLRPKSTERGGPVRAAGFLVTRKTDGKLASRGGNASIPARTEPWGFEEDHGVLVKNLPPRVDPEDIGPGRYNPNEHNYTTERYKGTGFGRRTDTRVLATEITRPGPAPGEYDPDSAKHEPTVVGKHAGFNATASRHVGSAPTVVKEICPAPNNYSLPSTLERDNPSNLQCFGSTTVRFGTSETVTPAPGSYVSGPSAVREAKLTSVTWAAAQRSPFYNSTPRFPGDHVIRQTPGPGTYAPESLPAASMTAASAARAGSPSATFGATGARVKPFITAEAVLVPGPGAYEPDGTVVTKASPMYASFKSKSTRPWQSPSSHAAVSPSRRADTSPPPLLEEGISGRDPSVVPAVPSVARATTEPPPFLSGAKRELKLLQPGMVAVPPPTAYNPPPQSAPGGRMADHVKERFGSSATPVPAPSSYQPIGSLVKPTFNITLGGSIAAPSPNGPPPLSPLHSSALLVGLPSL